MRKYPVMDDYISGRSFGNLLLKMHLKLSHKDLILLIGIVVAVVIALTTWIYSDSSSSISISNGKGKSTASLVINKFLKKTEAPVCIYKSKS